MSDAVRACGVALAALLSGCSPGPESTADFNKLTYHNNAERTGWNAWEATLTPAVVSSDSFGLIWRSERFDAYGDAPPRLYASPLYVDEVEIGSGDFSGETLSIVYAATTTGYVYAVNAFAADDVPAGTRDGTPSARPGAIIWRARLTGKPCANGAFGILSTPTIDLATQRLYVTSCDIEEHWRAHALDLGSGAPVEGWPVRIDSTAVNAPGINKNGTTQFPNTAELLQRGALTLAADGSRLYVTFGAGAQFANGWIIAIDTRAARVASAFSATATTEERQGGMWGSNGATIDREGRIYVVTGANSAVLNDNIGIEGVFPESPNNWGQSILQLTDDPDTGFELVGTYTPFNYCQAAAADIDLGSSGTVVIDLDSASTSTPHLLALGGAKQGNAYLLDRSRLPGGVTKRPACSADPASDGSLLAPDNQPHFGKPGPINVFGPYTDEYGLEDQAKSRSTAAYFRDARGRNYLFVTGSAKRGAYLSISTPPGLARLEIVTAPGRPAHLRIDQLEETQTFFNPGSPVVTSNGGEDPIVWVLDANAPRIAPLHGPQAPRPVLYAFDALTLKLLWKSAPGVLSTSGRYNEPTVVRRTVFVGTDRIEAFGVRPESVAGVADVATAEPAAAPPVLSAADSAAKLRELETAAEDIGGAALYEQRCATCHDSGRGGVPHRDSLALLSREEIFDALLNGAMQVQAFGLSEPEQFAVAAYLSSLDVATAAPIGNITPARLRNADGEPGAWLTGGRDYRQSYYSPLAEIDTSNVRELGFAWAHEIEYYNRFEATPIVVDGVLFTSGRRGAVYALDAATGAPRWQFTPDTLDIQALYRLSCCGAVNRGVAVWRGRVYVASFDGYLYALDAATGAVLWKVDTIDDRARGYTVTGAPYIANERVVIGNAGADLDARGYITAYDHATGKQAWRFYTVPGDPSKDFEHPELETAAKTWDPKSRWDLGLGGTAWDGMAYDPALNLLYVGTGNGTPWPRHVRSPSGGDNLYLSSILAIDPDNGRLVWHYQTVPGDNWDYTATQKMILADLTIDGRVRQVIMQAPKNGFFYVLDRRTGELLSAEPFVKVTWASHVDLETGRPVETGQGDYSKDPRLIFPGAWGGHSWQPMAYNPTTGLVYIPAFDIPMVFKMPSEPFQRGQHNMAVHIPLTGAGTLPTDRAEVRDLPPIVTLASGQPDHRSRAYLKAWNPVREEVVWQVETTSDTAGLVEISSTSGVMTTAGGLVFQGRERGQFVALDAATGVELHRIDVGNRMVAAPMTYIANGNQYVAIMAADQRGGVGRVLAFTLGGGAVPQSVVAASGDTAPAVPPSPAVARAQPEPPGTPEQIRLGGRLFERHCATCHASGRAPDLAKMSQQAHAEFLEIVLEGRRADRGMGSFGAVLSSEDAEAIHRYVMSLVR